MVAFSTNVLTAADCQLNCVVGLTVEDMRTALLAYQTAELVLCSQCEVPLFAEEIKNIRKVRIFCENWLNAHDFEEGVQP